jgi:hypothetical protein
MGADCIFHASGKKDTDGNIFFLELFSDFKGGCVKVVMFHVFFQVKAPIERPCLAGIIQPVDKNGIGGPCDHTDNAVRVKGQHRPYEDIGFYTRPVDPVKCLNAGFYWRSVGLEDVSYFLPIGGNGKADLNILRLLKDIEVPKAERGTGQYIERERAFADNFKTSPGYQVSFFQRLIRVGNGTEEYTAPL